MDLRQLRYFLCVAEELHFGRAARRLGISQPPLSQQIRALETTLDVDLFERTSRRVSLTEAGRLFLPEARETLAQANRAINTARRVRSGHAGALSLGFTMSAPFVSMISRSLYHFRQTHPDVRLTLTEMGRNQQIAAIEMGKCQLGIARSFDNFTLPPDFACSRLLEEDTVLAMREDHPLAAQPSVDVADLHRHAFIRYDAQWGSGFNEQFDALCAAAGFTPNYTQEVSGLATLMGFVSAGFGIAALAQSLTLLRPEGLVYRPITGQRFTSYLWLLHKKELSPAGEALKACFERFAGS
jgi:DNA-binding transcriptional LysR family regulator